VGLLVRLARAPVVLERSEFVFPLFLRRSHEGDHLVYFAHLLIVI